MSPVEAGQGQMIRVQCQKVGPKARGNAARSAAQRLSATLQGMLEQGAPGRGLIRRQDHRRA